MEARYRHTQIGWVIIGCAGGAAAIISPPLRAARLPLGPAIIVAAVALAVLLFTTLTVEVDGEEIRVRFTAGVIRRRIALEDVRWYREVRNPWYFGWGIHAVPGGTLWNVSGLDAVELALKDGRRFRIGTDEPAALAMAIQRVLGRREPSIGEDRPHAPTRARRGPTFALAVGTVLVLGSLLAVTPFHLQMQPPKVTVSPQGFSVRSLFYGDDYAMSDVTDISLANTLPCILARTNGFAGAGTLRGHFRVQGLGEGKLFVEQGTSPYVIVRMRRTFVIINFEQPSKTEGLFDELRRNWSAPARATESQPAPR
jgi:hypothetical protein